MKTSPFYDRLLVSKKIQQEVKEMILVFTAESIRQKIVDFKKRLSRLSFCNNKKNISIYQTKLCLETGSRTIYPNYRLFLEKICPAVFFLYSFFCYCHKISKKNVENMTKVYYINITFLGVNND